MFGKKTVCCVVLNGDSPFILLLIRLRSLSPRSALVHLQERFWVMSCSGAHELAERSHEAFRRCS